ncbi:MAG: hypothetical protein AUG81_09685 [Verrucomicrobia bacterium 13_1_20CM_4_54_11]|nr:MAG: hypothetical protein AUG81_09685 [Verrucomicrobia bacterium 13_1_20CM_4_54_11]
MLVQARAIAEIDVTEIEMARAGNVIKLIAKVAIAVNRQEVDDQSDKCETSNDACRYPTIYRRSFHAVDLARIAFWKKAFLPRDLSKVKKISCREWGFAA